MRLNLRKYKFREVAPIYLRVFEDYRAHGYVQSTSSMWFNSVKQCKNEILLRNAKYSRDPTYKELIHFIKASRVNMKRFIPERYVCRHYATKLHNKAEKLGIRAGVVYIEFTDTDLMHCINVFDTRDKGLVFIDCTGIRQTHTIDYTARVELGIDMPYTKEYLFTDKVVELNWIVKRFDITW